MTVHPSAVVRCTLPDHGVPCGRAMVRFGDAAPICPQHDRVKCRCGHRLVRGDEVRCGACGRDNRLQTVLKGGA